MRAVAGVLARAARSGRENAAASLTRIANKADFGVIAESSQKPTCEVALKPDPTANALTV